MLPTLPIGPWNVNTYTVVYIVAITVGGMLAFHRLLQLDQPVERINRGIILTILGGFAGAFATTHLVTFLHHLLRPDLTESWGGSTVLGAVAGGTIVAVLYIRHYGVPLGQPFDLGGIPIPLSQAIGRLGCFARGCCFGKVTHSWIGMYLYDNSGHYALRYPTQLMSSAINLSIFVILLVVERNCKKRLLRLPAQVRPATQRIWPFDGFIFLLYVELYSLKRFWIEFLRGDALPPFLGPFNLVQLICVVVFVVALIVIAWNWLKSPVRSEVVLPGPPSPAN
jgi:phosphatidylglycerol:prolipoprotein diacylglycerol transferase